MTYFVNTDKSTYAPGEQITITYNLDDIIKDWGAISLGIQANDGAERDPDIQFQPVQGGNQTRTFTFQPNTSLAPGNYVVLGHEGSMQDEAFARFNVQIAAGWSPLGGNFTSVSACCDVPYGLDSAGRVSMYNFDTTQWMMLDGVFKRMVGAHMVLYAVTSDGSSTVQLNDDCATWTSIGPGMDDLFIGGEQLYGIKDGQIQIYGGASTWTQIGATAAQIAANDRYVFRRDAQGQVSMYTPAETGIGQWSALTGTIGSIAVAGNALYGTNSDNTVWRYDTASSAWSQIGSGFSQIAAGDNMLLAKAADGSWWMFSGTPNIWLQYSSAADSVVYGDQIIFGVAGGAVSYIEPELVNVSPGAPAAASPGLLGDSPGAANWIFTFYTADKWLAGYDGTVHMEVCDRSSLIAFVDLETTHFERGVTYTLPLHIPDVTDIIWVKFWSDDNFFSEQWNVDTITAWSLDTRTRYQWNWNKDIPLPGQHPEPETPNSVTPRAPSPTGTPIVYIWTYRGSKAAWGHASMSLSNGDHISWWPNAPKPKDFPFLALNYTADANPNQTLADDISMESEVDDMHKMPDVGLPIYGLDETAIRNWWATFKTTHQWKLVSQNCSTTIFDALVAGGANNILTSRESQEFNSIPIWTPEHVMVLAQTLQSH